MANYLISGRTVIPVAGEKTLTVGRTSDNDLIVNNKNVSRRHSEFCTMNSRFVVRDLDSANGTWVNGERIKERNLEDQDQIEIGNQVFIYRQSEDIGELHSSMQRLVEEAAFMVTAEVEGPASLPNQDFGGSLEAMGILELCQMLEIGQRSGRMSIQADGVIDGTIVLHKGQILFAECGDAVGEEAVRKLLALLSGSFSFQIGDSEVEPNVSRTTQQILLDAARHADESG